MVGLLLLLALGVSAPAANAAVPPALGQFGPFGEGVGQLKVPAGMATNEVTGHLYVTDRTTSRVSEFTAWGEFVKSFGWDVSPGPVDEEQEVRVRATSGQFRLSFEGSETGDLAFDALGAEVEAALDALPSISGAGGDVEVSGGLAGIPGVTPAVYVVRFGGGLAAADVADLTAADGTVPLAGGSPTTLSVGSRATGGGTTTGFEACTAASGCQQGSAGGGAGQFNVATGVTVGPDGSIYVYDHDNFRVQKFDDAGNFLLMWGREVNKTTGEDLCTAGDMEGGDVCGAGLEGTGSGEFSIKGLGTLFNYVDLSPDGNTVYVGDKNRIQKFNPGGSFLGEITFAGINATSPEFPAEGRTGALAVDPLTGDVYMTFAQGLGEANKIAGIFRLSPTGALLDRLHSFPPGEAVEGPEALATDAEGSVYAVERPVISGITRSRRVVKFDSAGALVISYDDEFAEAAGDFIQPGLGLATNSIGNLYVGERQDQPGSHISSYGPSPFPLEPPPKAPPAIEDQFAVAAGITTASLKAEINPLFWADTRYYVEYGLADCASSTCATSPVPPGSLLTESSVNTPVDANVSLSGLTEDTTYHFRFVAQSTGGGPVVGPDATFRTARSFTHPPCPANESFRVGPSSILPDCRAYEMVSPVDKQGSDIFALCENTCYPARLDQSAVAGNSFTYSTYKSFGDAQSAPYSSQYLATRGGNGWENDGISPPQSGPILFKEGLSSTLDAVFKAFDPELKTGWVIQARAPSLSGSGASPNLYRRDDASGTYEPLVGNGSLAEPPELQGLTPDGGCAVFRVKDKLTSNAVEGIAQVYRSCDGNLELISILPGGAVSTKASSAGTPGTQTRGRWSSVQNAISDDGNRVFWSEAVSGSGPLYVRFVAEGLTAQLAPEDGLFWGASPDGSKAIYDQGSNLFEAAIASGGGLSTTKIAGEVSGVMGMSEDASSLYFVSEEDLDGGGGAESGAPNIYLRKSVPAVSVTFVTRLAPLDLVGPLSPVASEPILRTARISEDGEHAVFMSAASLTGFDNEDAESGKADVEVFRYDAGSAEMACISCNPTGIRPTGRELRDGANPTGLWGAAQLPPIESQLYASRVITADGGRVFFESFEALVTDDVNDKKDVYQWEEPGVGGCVEGEANFQESSGGCLDLISSGNAPGDAEFLDASSSGNEVFFTTQSSLVSQDPDQIDIYSARVDGGFPPPPPPSPACKGEACQPQVPGPGTPSLPSAVPGPGNPPLTKPKPKPKTCPKGKHRVKRKGKVRCVKNRKQHRAGRGRG